MGAIFVTHILSLFLSHSLSTNGKTNDYWDQNRYSGTNALPNCATNKCKMDNETDDFETNLSLIKGHRAAGGRRYFSQTWKTFLKWRQNQLYNQRAMKDDAITGKSRGKTICLCLEAADGDSSVFVLFMSAHWVQPQWTQTHYCCGGKGPVPGPCILVFAQTNLCPARKPWDLVQKHRSLYLRDQGRKRHHCKKIKVRSGPQKTPLEHWKFNSERGS